MYANKKVIVVLPAYNAAKTLEKTVAELPDLVDEIILVDDASHDNTAEIAKKLGLFVYCHAKNSGYGANQKSCYRLALERGADIVVMVHPDYQYDPRLVSYFASFIAEDYFDVMLG
jgi:glycosyltransferase involved in cell wall biosynthesis